MAMMLLVISTIFCYGYGDTKVLIEFCRHLHFDTKSSEEVTKVDEIYKLIWVHFDFILCQTSVVSVVKRLELDLNGTILVISYNWLYISKCQRKGSLRAPWTLFSSLLVHLCFADNDLEEPTKLIRVIDASSSSCCLVDYQL